MFRSRKELLILGAEATPSHVDLFDRKWIEEIVDQMSHSQAGRVVGIFLGILLVVYVLGAAGAALYYPEGGHPLLDHLLASARWLLSFLD